MPRYATKDIQTNVQANARRAQLAFDLSQGSHEKADRIMFMPMFAVAMEGQRGMHKETDRAQRYAKAAA